MYSSWGLEGKVLSLLLLDDDEEKEEVVVVVEIFTRAKAKSSKYIGRRP